MFPVVRFMDHSRMQKSLKCMARQRFDLLVEQMAERDEVTEQLMEQDQILWVRKMNNIWVNVERL